MQHICLRPGDPYAHFLKHRTFEPTCTQRSKVTATQGYHFLVKLRSDPQFLTFLYKTSQIGSPCQQYLRLWTEFHFVQTPWWLRERQLCSCDVVLTDGCLGWHRIQNCADQLEVWFGQSFLWSASLFVALLVPMLLVNQQFIQVRLEYFRYV